MSSAPSREPLRQPAKLRRFAKNDIIFAEGDPSDGLYIVTEGRVLFQVTTEDGDIVALDVAGPGDVFGELALLDRKNIRTATALALDSVATHYLSTAAFEELLQQAPQYALNLAGVLAERVERLTGQLRDVLHLDADARVARRLWTIADRFGAQSNGATVPLTQQHIADLTGLTRPTVNQILQNLRADGVVALPRGGFAILQPEVLKAKAGM